MGERERERQGRIRESAFKRDDPAWTDSVAGI